MTETRYLLDTHALIWWVLGIDRLSAEQRSAIETAVSGPPLLVSDISLWEIATLVSLGRLELDLPVRDWLTRATAPPLVRLHRITAAVAAEVAALPDSFHRDPADRTIVATARVHGAALITSDRRVVRAGLVATVS